MEKETKITLMNDKEKYLEAYRLNCIISRSLENVMEILPIVHNLPEGNGKNALLEYAKELFHDLTEAHLKTAEKLDTAQELYIGTLENMADEEELFFVDAFGHLSFPDDEEEPEEE